MRQGINHPSKPEANCVTENVLSMEVFSSLVLKIRLSTKNVFAKHRYLGIERKQRWPSDRAAMKHAYTPVLCLKGIHTSATKRSHVYLLMYLLLNMY